MPYLAADPTIPLTPEEEYLLSLEAVAEPVPPPVITDTTDPMVRYGVSTDTSMYTAPVETQYQTGGASYQPGYAASSSASVPPPPTEVAPAPGPPPQPAYVPTDPGYSLAPAAPSAGPPPQPTYVPTDVGYTTIPPAAPPVTNVGSPTPYQAADPAMVDTRSLTTRISQETPFRGIERAPYVAPPPPPPTFRPFDEGTSLPANMDRLALERKRNQSTQPETFRGIEQAHGGGLGPPTPTLDFLLPLRKFIDEGGDVYSLSDMIGRFAGLEPDDPNADMYNQITRNLYDLGGDILGDTLRAAGGLAQKEGRGAQLLLGDPLLRAGDVKDWLWHAAEDVLGAHGALPRQMQSTFNPLGETLARDVRDPLGAKKDAFAEKMDPVTDWWKDHPGAFFDKVFWDADAAYRGRNAAAGQAMEGASEVPRTTLDAGRRTATDLANAVQDVVDRIPTPTGGLQDAAAAGRALQGRLAGEAIAERIDPDTLANLARAGLQGLRTMDLPSLEMPTAPPPTDTSIPVPPLPSFSPPDVSGALSGAQDTANATLQRARGAALAALLRGDPRAQQLLSALQAVQGIDLPDIPTPDVAMGNIPDVSAVPDFLQENVVNPIAAQLANIGGATPRSAFLPGSGGRSASKRPPRGDGMYPSIPGLGDVDIPDVGQAAADAAATVRTQVIDPITARLGGGRDSAGGTPDAATGATIPGMGRIGPGMLANTTTDEWQTLIDQDANYFTTNKVGKPRSLEIGGTRQKLIEATDAPGLIIGYFDDNGIAHPLGGDMTEEEAIAEIVANAAEAEPGWGESAAVPAPDGGASPATDTATDTATKTAPTPGVTLEDASVPAPSGTGGGSSRSSGSSGSSRSSGSGSSRSSGGGGGYDRSSGGDSFSRGYDREFTADDFMTQAGGDRRKAASMAKMANRRRKKTRGSVGSAGGFWEGFPFNRPPSDIRNLVLTAIAESQAAGRARKGR